MDRAAVEDVAEAANAAGRTRSCAVVLPTLERSATRRLIQSGRGYWLRSIRSRPRIWRKSGVAIGLPRSDFAPD